MFNRKLLFVEATKTLFSGPCIRSKPKDFILELQHTSLFLAIIICLQDDNILLQEWHSSYF